MAGHNNMAGAEELVNTWNRINTSNILVTNRKRLANSAISTSGFYTSKPAIKALTTMLPYNNIEDAPTKLRVVTTRMADNRAFSWSTGDVYSLLQASTAIPGVFDPVLLNGELHTDGGVAEMIPLGHALMMNPKQVIVLDVSGSLFTKDYWKDSNVSGVYGTLLRGQTKHLKNFLADPRVGVVSLQLSLPKTVSSILDFNNSQKLVELGVEAANQQMRDIKNSIERNNREQKQIGRTIRTQWTQNSRYSVKDETGIVHTV